MGDEHHAEGDAQDESAEFAVVVADEWQGRGVAWVLMERLLDCARRRGLKRKGVRWAESGYLSGRRSPARSAL